MITLSVQRESNAYQETEIKMEEIKEALLGFAMSHNGRLPCPDNGDDDGNENVLADTSTDADGFILNRCNFVLLSPGYYEGLLPYADLGVSQNDPWGRPYRYIVFNYYSNYKTKPPETIVNKIYSADENISTLGVYSRKTSDKSEIDVARSVAVIIISHGKNGLGAYKQGSLELATSPATGTDEEANAGLGDRKLKKYTRIYTPSVSGECSDTRIDLQSCEFDDAVSYLPTSIFISKMVAAGKLP